jgi:hypothetical protein
MPEVGFGDVRRAIGAETIPDSRLDEMRRAFEGLAQKCAGGLIRPSLVARSFRIADSTGEAELVNPSDGSTVRISCPEWLLSGASELVAVVSTVGPWVEEEIQRYFDSGDPLLGVVLDALACLALEETNKAFQSQVREALEERGMTMGPRISPGCQAVPLTEQAVIFSLIDTSAIGVSLTSDYLMRPLKSSSFLLPVGTSISERLQTFNSCEMCTAAHRCHYKQDISPPIPKW